MALSTAQQTIILYKKLRGLGHTNDARQFFEEPYGGRPAVFPTQVWNQQSSIPNTAPALADGATSGVVQRFINRSMTTVSGTTNAFYLVDLVDSIPFNYGDGTSYNIVLTDSTGASIPFGQNDWVLDPESGLVAFEQPAPSNMPPKISFYKYIGTKGVGSGSGGGGNLNGNANGASGTSDWSSVEDVITATVGGTNNLVFTPRNGTGTYNVPTGTPGYFTGSPAPLTAGTIYYAISNGTTVTGVSLTPGGAAVSITATAGASTNWISRPGSTNVSYVPGSQTGFTIAADTPSGSGFVLSKTGVNALGFNIEKADIKLATTYDLTHPLFLSIDYDTATANTYQAGAVKFYLQELSSGIQIELTDFVMAANTKGTMSTTIGRPGNFFTTTQFKLIARMVTNTLSTMSFKLANVSYQPIYAPAVSSGTNENPNPNGQYGTADWIQATDQQPIRFDTSNNWLNGQIGFGSDVVLPIGTAVQFLTGSGATLPTAVSEGTTYYIITPSPWKVATTPGGSAVSFAGASGTSYVFTTTPPVSTAADNVNPTQTRTTIVAKTPLATGFTISKTAAKSFGDYVFRTFILTSVWQVKKSLQVSFDYNMATGGTWGIYVREVNTNTMTKLGTISPLASGAQNFTAQMTTGTTTVYELIFRNEDTSIFTYTFDVGNVAWQTLSLPMVAVAQTVPDFSMRISTFTPSYASTANKILSLLGGTPGINTVGSGLTYLDDSVNGARFVATRAGLARFGFSADLGSAGADLGFSYNSTNLTTSWTSLSSAERIICGYDGGGGSIACVTAEVYMNIGDTVRLHGSGNLTSPSSSYSGFYAAMVGIIQAITAVKDQKLKLLTSEVSFYGSAARGSTDTFVIKYDNVTNLRNDGLTITNTAANGTIIQVNRDGILDLSYAVGVGGSAAVFLSRNQQTLTAIPAASEILNSSTATAVGYAATGSWSGKVYAGDKIRLVSSVTPSNAYMYNELTALLWDDTINLAINTVQPQWSQSDSYVDCDTFNTFASTTNSLVPRYSNFRQGGQDLQIIDDPILGTYAQVLVAGVFTVTNTVCGSDGTNNNYQVANAINPSSYTALPTGQNLAGGNAAMRNTGATDNVPISATWEGQLAVGDKIFPMHKRTTPAVTGYSRFTVVKTGKPNLTSVDVTPFVTQNAPVYEDIRLLGNNTNPFGTTATGVFRYSSVFQNTGNGVVAYSDDVAGGTVFTAIKDCQVDVQASMTYGTQAINYFIAKNPSSLLTNGGVFGTSQTVANTISMSGSTRSQVSWSGSMVAGDKLYIMRNEVGGNLDTTCYLSLKAAANVSTVQSASSLVSSDTMALAFKSTAIDPNGDPVGTFNTYTYASGTQTPTLATTAPTQTTADMNANGILITGRATNATSTAAAPARVDIFLGKGLKDYQVFSYTNTGKTNPVDCGYIFFGGGAEQGVFKSYNEITGILTITAGLNGSGGTTAHTIGVNTATNASPSAAYFVITAAKLPAQVSVIQPNTKQLYNAPYAAAVAFRADYAGNRLLLTGSVSSSNIPAGYDGQVITMAFVQDSTGGRTFVWPTNMVGGITVGTTANKRSSQSFFYSANDGLWIAQDTGVTNV